LEKAFNGIPSSDSMRVKSYHSKQFFSHKLTLWEPQTPQSILIKGEYTWDFSFQLAEDVPPSMHFDDWLFVFFQARGYVEPLDKKNVRVAKIISEPVLFDVVGLKETRWVARLAEALPVVKSEKFKNDTLSINAHLKKKLLAYW